MNQNRDINVVLNSLDSTSYIPSYIFHNRHYTILEALIVYLRERRKLSFRKVAALLNRDLRYVFNSYQNAKKKELITEYRVSSEFVQIPILIFADRKISALESVVVYLKEEHSMSYHKIAVMLNRDDRTIWTAYNRAGKKRANEKIEKKEV